MEVKGKGVVVTSYGRYEHESRIHENNPDDIKKIDSIAA